MKLLMDSSGRPQSRKSVEEHLPSEEALFPLKSPLHRRTVSLLSSRTNIVR